MAYALDHIHLKAADPKATADWYVRAFNFSIVNDAARPSGDRFVRCKTADGITVNISSARRGERLAPGDAGVHLGLEHFGVAVDDLASEIERLKGMGASLLDGPRDMPGGGRIAFIEGPDTVRIELLQHSR